MPIERRLLRAVVPSGWLMLAAFLTGCPGTLDDKERFATTGTGEGAGDVGGCGDVPTTLIAPKCATANCHDAEAPPAALDLTADAGLASRLVGVAGVCDGLLVDPEAPSSSLMYTKCLATNACNTRMPITGTKLTAEEEQCLLTWLESL
jgi:hypothetical protein